MLLGFSLIIPNFTTEATTLNDESIIKEVKNLIEKKGGGILTEKEFYKTMGISKNEAKIARQLEFDSIDEFKNFLDGGRFASLVSDTPYYLDQTPSLNSKNLIDYNINNELLSQTLSSGKTYNSSHIWKRWHPVGFIDLLGPIGTTLTWKNISFNYSYRFVNGKPRFISVSNLKSYISGLNTIQWIERTSHYNIVTTNNYNDTVKFTAEGQYYYGIAIKGVVIGITTPHQKWNGALRIY